jgi:phosphohistidine phosphatase
LVLAALAVKGYKLVRHLLLVLVVVLERGAPSDWAQFCEDEDDDENEDERPKDSPIRLIPMKTLLLLRHGKSRWDRRGVADHERGLKRRGKRDAARIGRLLADERLLPHRVISSTAKRARGTARRLAKACDHEGEVELHPELYLGDPPDYFDVLRWLPDEVERVLVVGHNPGLEELIEHVTGKQEPLPTAGLAQLRLPIERWSDLSDAVRGDLVALWRPKELKRQQEKGSGGAGVNAAGTPLGTTTRAARGIDSRPPSAPTS